MMILLYFAPLFKFMPNLIPDDLIFLLLGAVLGEDDEGK